MVKNRWAPVLKKRYLLIVFIVYLYLASSPVRADWTGTEVVSTESTSWSMSPSLCMGSDGTVHIAWQDLTDYEDAGSDWDIFYKRWNWDTGWTTTEVVSTESTSGSQSPSLCMGSDGEVHIAWDDSTDYDDSGSDSDIFYRKYIPDYGWTMTEVVSTESTGNSMDPSLGVDPDGTIHVAWREFTDYGDSGWDTDIFYKRWDWDTGWTTTEVVSTESTRSSGPPSLGVGPDGAVHIVWDDPTGELIDSFYYDTDIFYRGWDPDTGWTTTEVVSTESTSHSTHPSLGVGSDGTIHVAWDDETDYEGSFIDRDIFYKKYKPGVGWTMTEVVSTESTRSTYKPSLCVGSDGAVHIAWEDYTDYEGSGTDYDIFYRGWDPDTGWTTTEVVSTESTRSAGTPSLGVSSGGTIHVVWRDGTDYDGSGEDDDILYKRWEAGLRRFHLHVSVIHALFISILPILLQMLCRKFPGFCPVLPDPTPFPWNHRNVLIFVGAFAMLISSVWLVYFRPSDFISVFLGGVAYGVGMGLVYLSLIQYVRYLPRFQH